MITAWIVSVLRIWRVGICTFEGLTPRNRAELSVAACGLSNGVTPFSSTIQVHRAGRSPDTSPSHPARKRLPRELQIVNRPRTHPVRNTEIVESLRVQVGEADVVTRERQQRITGIFGVGNGAPEKTSGSVCKDSIVCASQTSFAPNLSNRGAHLSDCSWHRLSTPQKL
jgi:hypothetical protein